ncbi:MAG TPA: phosphatidylglycerophosphatase A [Pseudomonadales bacterium]
MNKVPPGSFKHPIHFLALGFGSGAAPVAPGTFGTLAAIPIYLLCAQLPLLAYLGVVVIVCISGVYICGRTADDWGMHDHSAIVWDEIAGYLLTMILAPVSMLSVLLGFAYFRLFDIWKPYPISWLDKKVSGGFGIMVDDLLAGVYAAILLQMSLYAFKQFGF